MVPAGSRRIPRVLRYSGGGPARLSVSPTGLSPSTAGVSTPLGYASTGFLRPLLLPRRARRHAPGLGSSAFARRYSRNHCCFLLLRVLRCFSSPRWPHSTVVSSRTGSPIRTPADRPVFAGPRGFSQLVTSFFASGSLRHPPCALLRFPFVFSAPLRRFAAGGFASVVFYSLLLLFHLRVHHVNDLPFS